MTSKKLSRREKLELAIAQKHEQLKNLNAQERVKERKRETRKKIVAGGIVLQHAQDDIQFKTVIDRLLNQFVTNDNDRDLFNLPAIIQSSQDKEEGAQ